MECDPSQCTLNVYLAVICFDNLNCFFKLGLTLQEFFYFFEVKHCKKYAQLRAHKEKLKTCDLPAKKPTLDLVRLLRNRGLLTFFTEVQVVCISQGMRIELGRLLICLESARHLPSYERSTMELIQHC
ncbi:unnamed protein product [Prunus armeniaca]